MSLNTIELPEFIIAELYRDSLLASDAPSQPKPLPAGLTPPAKKTAAAVTVISTLTPAIPLEAAPATSPSRQKESSPFPYKFLGNNGRKITLVVESPGIAYLPDEQLAFLSKMLEACKMNIGDVALVNHASTAVVISTLKSQLQPTVLVLFGIEPVGISLPINFPQYKIQPYDQCDYLYVSSLEELVKPTEEGKLLKSKLWVSLRQLFGV